MGEAGGESPLLVLGGKKGQDFAYPLRLLLWFLSHVKAITDSKLSCS